jgi:heat shock protein HslJ
MSIPARSHSAPVALLLAFVLGACGGEAPDAGEDAAAGPVETPARSLADELVGEWRLVMIDMGDGDDVQPGGETPPTVDFTAEADPTGSRRYTGTGGCNRIMGSYDAGSTGRFSLSAGSAMTMMACPDPVMRVERIFVTALESATAYAIDGSALSIEFGGGTIHMERTDAGPS